MTDTEKLKALLDHLQAEIKQESKQFPGDLYYKGCLTQTRVLVNRVNEAITSGELEAWVSVEERNKQPVRIYVYSEGSSDIPIFIFGVFGFLCGHDIEEIESYLNEPDTDTVNNAGEYIFDCTHDYGDYGEGGYPAYWDCKLIKYTPISSPQQDKE